MTGFTDAESAATLDQRYPTTGASDYLAYSEDGSTETTDLARTAVGATGWAAATTADPSVKANASTLVTDDASADLALTHFRVMDAATGGNARSDWTALTGSPVTILTGEHGEWAAGDLQITLT